MSPAPITIEVRKASRGSKRPATTRKPLKRVKIPLKPKKPLKKAKSLSKLKKELDTVFSLYIRAKYAKQCYTCDFTGTLQNGHFVPRQYLAVRWDENNCRPQCMNCNVFRHGRPLDFEEHLIREIGAERVQALKDKRKELWKLDRNWYETQITHYKELIIVYGTIDK